MLFFAQIERLFSFLDLSYQLDLKSRFYQFAHLYARGYLRTRLKMLRLLLTQAGFMLAQAAVALESWHAY